MSESDNLLPLRFHNVHGKGVTFSRDGTIARRIEDYGFVFSSRTIKIDEKVSIKIMEASKKPISIWSAFCFGVTSKNPNSTPFEDIRCYTYLDLIKNLDYLAVPLDKKLCVRNTILSFRIAATGHICYEVNGEEKGKVAKKIDIKTPFWALIYFFENPISIKLIRNNLSHEATSPVADELDEKIANKIINKPEDVLETHSVTNEETIVPPNSKLLETFSVTTEETEPTNSDMDTKECLICYNNIVNSVLYKCAHMCMCYACAMEQWKGRGDGHCPLCRTVIEDVIKPYTL